MRKVISHAMLVILLTAAYASGQKAVMRDGHPALECDQPVIGNWVISLVEVNGKPAFKIPINLMNRDNSVLYVSADRVYLQAHRASDSFDESRPAVTWEATDVLTVQVAGQKPQVFGKRIQLAKWPACWKFVQLTFSDFAGAEKQFDRLARELPIIREAAWGIFQPKAAAWRSLATKPPLSPEAVRQRILAENAFNEKNFDSVIEHYESAVEAQPTWPEGWFNLAMIYAEQKNYADAADRMKHYLELVPNAPDAKDARTQMIIWEDKAKH